MKTCGCFLISSLRTNLKFLQDGCCIISNKEFVQMVNDNLVLSCKKTDASINYFVSFNSNAIYL